MKITYKHNSPKGLWGRFGGGWQWKLGFQADAKFKTIILNLLIFYIRIEFGKE
jgi:hypothetical protein